MLWQGGFLFYAAIVVPTGTEVLGSFQQGRVTRHVTDSMNMIGVISLLILAWDQGQSSTILRKSRWWLWIGLATTLACLFWLHPKVEMHVDFAADGRVVHYREFYFWHRVYLCVSTAQWTIGLIYVVLMLCSWRESRHNSMPAPT